MTVQPLALLNSVTGSVQDLYNARRQVINDQYTDQMNPLLIQQQQMTNEQMQMQNKGLRSQQNITNTVSRLQELERQIGYGATPEQLAGTLQGFIQQSQASGGNPIDSQQALQVLQIQGVEGLQSLLSQAKQVFVNQGYMKPQASSAVSSDQFAKIDPSKFTSESLNEFQSSGMYSSLIPVNPDNVDPEYTKELRGELRKNVATLETEAKNLKTNFNKLKSLSNEMRSGNRSSVSQGLVALVKLGDPTSVVKEEELKMALGAQNPTAAVADVLRGNGVSGSVVNSIVQSLDPLNPDSINVDQVLATAEAMLSPNAQAIKDSFETAKTRGLSQLSEGGYRSIFGSRQRVFDDVGSLTFGVAPQQQAAQTQTFTTSGGQTVQFTVE